MHSLLNFKCSENFLRTCLLFKQKQNQKNLWQWWHIWYLLVIHGLPWWLRGLSVCLQCGRPGFNPWVRKIPWRRKWQPTPVFLPGESHGWRSLVGYSPRGHKESDKPRNFTFTVLHRTNSHAGLLKDLYYIYLIIELSGWQQNNSLCWFQFIY